MHSTTCGVSASATNLSALQTTGGGVTGATDAHKMVHHNNEDAMNKIPLKSASGLDDEEKNGGELMQDTEAAEEARREEMRAKMLAWMKKLTIVLICFIGIALISYVIISLCFSDWPKSTPNRNNTMATTTTAATVLAAAAATATTPATTTTTTTTTAIETTIAISTAPVIAQSAETATATATTATIIVSTTPTPNTTTESTPTTTTIPSNTYTSSNTLKTFTLTDEQQDAEHSSSSSSSNNNMDNLSIEDTLATTPSSGLLTPNVAASTLPTAMPSNLPPSEQLRYDNNATFVSKLGIYQKAAVCTDRIECSEVASDILKRNGSAVDAAIAALLCNGLLSAQSMGIGGGLLMNVYIRKNRHAYSIDAREVAPYAAEEDMFNENPSASLRGPLSIGVPGEVMGYYEAHKRFGKLPWSDLVAPSLKYCETGFYMSTHMATHLHNLWPKLKEYGTFVHYINEDTGMPYNAGSLIKPSKKLCATYKLLSDNGPMDFYNGTVANLLVEDLKELNSIIRADDLQAYEADVVNSITMDLGEDTLHVMPPVSSGSLIAHALSILQGFNFTEADVADDKSTARTYHRIAEAMKFAFAHRGELGDLRANDIRELVSQLNSPEYAANQRAKINDSFVLDGPQEYGAQYASNDKSHGTSTLTIVAPNGDAVSVTSSVNLYYGSFLVGPRTGIILNSAMNDFSVENNYFGLPPSQANVVGPYKRPMSSMSPLLLANKEGDIRAAIGAAGGSRILDAIVLVLARLLWFGQDLKTAIDAPRFHHQLFPDILEYQPGGFPETVLQSLAKRGHTLKAGPVVTSVVCAITRNATAIYANADYRKRGDVAGF